MAFSTLSFGTLFLTTCLLLLILPSPVAAFGAGNIPSIAHIEGANFRHGGTIYPSLDSSKLILPQISRICSRPLLLLKAINGLL